MRRCVPRGPSDGRKGPHVGFYARGARRKAPRERNVPIRFFKERLQRVRRSAFDKERFRRPRG
eukprot:1185635-Prorocentrum_minimum.AAC.2